MGDSGEELGVVSVTEAESKVEMVVVGDESVDSEFMEDRLSRWGNGNRKCESVGFDVCKKFCCCWRSPYDGPVPSPPSSLTLPRMLEPVPNTDMNDGNETGKDGR